ncbi:MAG TPA: signal peptidase I [Candidatus Saccharimonadales bacterium]|nr:signal peptidase I [Candidatus Saccharimonadales bacterium]
MGKLKGVAVGIGFTLFGVVALTILAFSLPFTGWRALSVLTGSMVPAINPGALVIVHSVPGSELKAGDVITFKSKALDDQFVTHRIVEVKPVQGGPTQFVTKGDANNGKDPAPVSELQVVGKVTSVIPGAGHIPDFIRSPLGLALFVYLPAAILFIYEVRLLVKRLLKLELEKQEKAEPKPQPAFAVAAAEAAPAVAVPAPQSVAAKPASKKIRPRVLDGLGVFMVGVLMAATVGTTQAAITGSATLTNNSITAVAPTPKVLIWRVNFPGAPDADVSFQPITYLYNPNRGTVPDLEGWRLESSSGLVFGFRGPTPLYAKNKFFDVHSGPSGKLLVKGDYLVLKDKAGNVVDAISWGTDTTYLNPAIQGITTRKDILRNDPAIDTNSAADWRVQVGG